MVKQTIKLQQNPWETVGFFKKWTFLWLLPLFIKGYNKPLEKEDLFVVQKEDESVGLGNRLAEKWEKEVSKCKLKNKKPSYIHALIKTFGLRYALVGLLAAFEECILRVGQPLCLGGLIRYYNNPESFPEWAGIMFSVGVMLGSLLYVFSHHPLFYGTQHTGMMIRISSCSLIYRKALRLSRASLGQTTVGQMVNLLSNDVNRFDASLIFLHYLWVGPLQTTLVTIILWNELGPACLAGIAILILSVPLQSVMGKMFSKLRAATAIRTDERIRGMNEIVNAMRVIKMYAWELPFAKMITEARRKEINKIMKTNYLRSVNMSLFFTSSKMIVFLALLTYVLSGNILTAEKVFVTTSLINNVRLTMTLFFPYAISMGSETVISCKRIQKFLEMEEREDCKRIDSSNLRPKPMDCFLEVNNIFAKWISDSKFDDLQDISFETKAGELLAIVGEVGSGKSSLLHALLKELPIHKGDIKIRGKISYASQEPWLVSGTVKDNILFGQTFKAKKYNEVIKVCALERDLEILPEGDESLVGERGVSLSGGQKARINLARAVYFDADIYLLDDPLSAVDTDVGKHLYEKCITQFLKNKVKILVTHQLQYIRTATEILVLSEIGGVEGIGTYQELVQKGIDFATLSKKVSKPEEATNISSIIPDGNDKLSPLGNHGSFRRIRRDSENFYRESTKKRTDSENNWYSDSTNAIYENGIDGSSTLELSAVGVDVSLNTEEESRKTAKQAAGEEVKSTGSIGFKIYASYLLAGGTVITLFILSCLSILTQFLFTGSDYWLSLWSNAEQRLGSNMLNGNSTAANETIDRDYYIYVYTGMTVGLFVFALIRTILFFMVCMTASKVLHNRMLGSIVNAPIQFFDTHPIGSILNRFTKDTGQVDDLLPICFYDFIEIMLTFVGVIIVVAYVNYWFVIPTLLLAVIFHFIRKVYLRSARDIKRLEGITRSPVFSHLSSSLYGLTTIRSMEAEGRFIEEFDKHQDLHSSSWFLFLCTTRSFGIWLDCLTCIYVAIVTFSFLGMEASTVLGGDVGLAISSAMMLSGMFQWGVRQSAEVENQMTSVERILEYTKIEPETPRDAIKEAKKENWPDAGELQFKNVSLYYDHNDPPVLKDLSFKIDSGSKIGIVGRTGAGKSSLLTCLFRLTEPQGEIILDGVDTSSISLKDLRQSISIIPQDPTLFNGTVRKNLDPFDQYDDDEIWNAIEEVQLKRSVQEMDGGLAAPISEGGGNLSVGQRQLICLARAILKRNKLLVMDEATANVDPHTDTYIQQTIRTKFLDCTVLTIAHRLHTIMDADKIMVMDAGKLEEFGEPYELLNDETSIFSQLVDHTGKSGSAQLRNIAKETHDNKVLGNQKEKLKEVEEEMIDGEKEDIVKKGFNEENEITKL